MDLYWRRFGREYNFLARIYSKMKKYLSDEDVEQGMEMLCDLIKTGKVTEKDELGEIANNYISERR